MSPPPAIDLPASFQSQGFVVRPARPADRDFERRLFESARRDIAVLATWSQPSRASFLDQQFEFQTTHYARANPRAERYIVTAKRASIGRLILDRTPRPWQVVDIALLASARGRGLGAALLSAVLAAAATAGANVVLTVEMGNPAQRLYERLGFVATETTPPHRLMEWRPPGGGTVS
ncbi:MAG: GNAT family N-acetyltransferase [Pseudolabrys sp.]